jgi:hypothetical protein
MSYGYPVQVQTAPRKAHPVASAWRTPGRSGTVAASKQVLSELQMNSHLALRTLLLLAFVAMAAAVLVHPGLGGTGDPAADAMLMLARN